jgi:hypothetical protein
VASKSLANLGLDVLGLITSLVDAFDIFSLWSTGDARIRAMIGQYGAVRRFELELKFSPRWPGLVSSFAFLEHLSIKADPCSRILAVVGATLNGLPSHLRSLKLEFESASRLLLGEPHNGSHPGIMPDLKTLFPFLETLRWDGNINTQFRPNWEQFLGLLPSTLTDLSLPKGRMALPITCLHLLPPHLVRFEAYFRRYSNLPPLNERGWPQNLQTLHVTKFPSLKLLVMHLPPNLRSLHVENGDSEDITVWKGYLRLLRPSLLSIAFARQMCPRSLSS